MERNKINFITGETYTLAELFSGNRRIVIPDLQRDYCWGDETNQKSSGVQGELVTDFIKNLIEQYDDQINEREVSPLNLGLFYGYEVPANHIQLCDGQQRLTTLYLLLGMLNKKVGKFRQYLISDFEYYDDDKEPYLNYAIRETSLYFLSDLVCKFFIDNTDSVDHITEADWYFNDYNHDPSICSMINALRKIEILLDDRDINWLTSFGDWVLNKLTFLYFDMENRKNGEETFVIINTTGEPLSTTQNLKPFVINDEINKDIDNIDKKWEEIEKWFWQNRIEDNGNDTADAGFAEFLRWVSIIEQRNKEIKDKNDDQEEMKKKPKEYLIQQILRAEGNCEFPYNNISFETIYSYWKTLIWLMDKKQKQIFPFNEEMLSPKINKDVNGRKAIGQNDCFVLLPVLSFVYKYQDSIRDDENMQRNAKRIYEFFENLRRIKNVSGNVNSLVRETLRIIDILEDKGGDIISILGSSEKVSKQILTDEEQCKLKILEKSDCRCEIEEAFWDIQRHEVWQGEIMPIIECSFNENGKFDINRFKKSEKIFHLLFCSQSSNGEISYKKDQKDDVIYLLRRCAILCAEPCEPYKLARRGSYYTFGWTWNDWHEILCTPNSHHSRMKYLFNYLLEKTEEENIENITLCKLKEILKNFIDKFKSTTQNDYVEFAEDGYLLSFTQNSYACDMNWGSNDWLICSGGGIGRHTCFFSRRNAYILQAFGGNYEKNETPLEIDNNWNVSYWDSTRSNCVVFRCDKKRIKLDIEFKQKEKTNNGEGVLMITVKTTDNKNISECFPKIMNALDGFDTKDGNVVTKKFESFSAFNIKEKIEETITKVNKFLGNNIEAISVG